MRRKVIAGALIAIVLAITALLYWKVYVYDQQIDNLELARRCDWALDEYHNVQHQYPSQRAAVHRYWRGYGDVLFGKDVWGHDMLYRSDGDRFVLVSFGRDSVPDTQEYEKLDELLKGSLLRICGEPNADRVKTDGGFRQVCGK